MTRGFCFVVDTAAYLDEAERSIASLRAHMPEAKVAVVTRPELFRELDAVDSWVALEGGRSGPIIKTQALRAPWDLVVFLDSDTFVAADLSGLFDVLEHYELAIAHEPNPNIRFGAEREVPEALPDFNTGMFAFRKTQEIEEFFSSWLEEYDRLLGAHGLRNDQPSFRNALWMSENVRVLALGSESNFLSIAPMMVESDVRLVHSRDPDLPALVRSINAKRGARIFVPGWGIVFPFKRRRQWVRQYLRLTGLFLKSLVNPRRLRHRPTPVKWWSDGID